MSIKSCRLCDNNTEQMHNIFSKTSNGQQILHLIENYLSLIVFRTDPLSKQICQKCLDQLEAFTTLKETSRFTANKHIKSLTNSEPQPPGVQLYLACNESKETHVKNNIPICTKNAETSTDDLKQYCFNCNQLFDEKNELELCSSEFKPNNRSQRRRPSQSFYHEPPDDSMCSSFTEFTNTEDSHCYSDMELCDSDDNRASSPQPPPAKRRKMETAQMTVRTDLMASNSSTNQRETFKNLYKNQDEFIYNPLSLLNLCLNIINKQHLEDYEPEEEIATQITTKCTYCGETFKNLKLLALHEVDHIHIELGEKVDTPSIWHESRDDALIRNKWLNSVEEAPDTEEEEEEEDAAYLPPEDNNCTEDETEEFSADDSLLIPVGCEEPNDSPGQVELLDGEPMVNGRPLRTYTKSERKLFYKSMKVGNTTKKFCSLCRYMFKDNWGIEGHYFSLACFFSCRYCGERFNNKRDIFDEHVKEHEKMGDKISNKVVYVSCKLSNLVPKVMKQSGDVNEEEILRQETQLEFVERIQERSSHRKRFASADKYHARNRSLTPTSVAPVSTIKIKQEKVEKQEEIEEVVHTSRRREIRSKLEKLASQHPINTSTSGPSQAYFCRKCYKVFFRLDEFNIHSKNCDLAQFPQGRTNFSPTKQNGSSSEANKPVGKVKPTSSSTSSSPIKRQSSGEMKNGEVMYSASGRPIRQVVKYGAPYRDGSESPPSTPPPPSAASSNHPPIKGPNGELLNPSVVCFVCNTSFPTIYSRNSHMRIHKGETPKNLPPAQPHPTPYNKALAKKLSATKSALQSSPTYSNYIKKEPIEPEDEELSDTESNVNRNSFGSVSITPISKNPNQKPKINPNIMKLVQSNPHLTIKSNKSPDRLGSYPNKSGQSGSSGGAASTNNRSAEVVSPSSNDESNKSYRCSGCFQNFHNKSQLYHHKKNQCNGSRFPCPFCKKRFGTENAYSSHIFYSHPE